MHSTYTIFTEKIAAKFSRSVGNLEVMHTHAHTKYMCVPPIMVRYVILSRNSYEDVIILSYVTLG